MSPGEKMAHSSSWVTTNNAKNHTNTQMDILEWFVCILICKDNYFNVACNFSDFGSFLFNLLQVSNHLHPYIISYITNR